jgi:hypothetical protein
MPQIIPAPLLYLSHRSNFMDCQMVFCAAFALRDTRKIRPPGVPAENLVTVFLVATAAHLPCTHPQFVGALFS